MTANDNTLVLCLTRAQAIVLYEWLSKLDQSGKLQFHHEAEQRVAWAIEGQLENTLVEILSADYLTLLAAARNKVISE